MTVFAGRRGTARAGRRECAARVRASASAGFVRRVRACAAAGVLASAFAFGTAAAQTPPTPPGTVVRNTATVTFDRAPGVAETRLSNEVATTILPSRTRATAALLRAQVDAAGTTPVGPAQCVNAAGTAVDLPNPTLLGGTVLDATRPATVVDERVFHGGEPVFLRVADGDRNLDATVRDWLDVRLVAGTTNDAEVVRLLETGPNTGVFTGYLQTRVGAPSAGDCVLQVARASTLEARYADVADATDVSVAAATLDPQGTVFDSRTGQPVNGAIVRLVDAATGLPADVRGDDGRSRYPSEVASGGVATDDGGTQYQFPPGTYRFPLVARPGTYRLIVEAPAGYAFPTQVAEAELQALPGAPWLLTGGSFGRDYAFASPAAATIDVPLDAIGGPLVLGKSTASASAAIGDAVQYSLTLRNAGPFPVREAFVDDRLPPGFRYVEGSARLGDARLADPAIDATGRGLTFALGEVSAGATLALTYVARIGAGAKSGEAVNRARARAGTLASNEAAAGIVVTDELFRSRGFVVGRLTRGGCEGPAGEGVADVRVYLEDGRYVVTDSEGRYHFEDVAPGTHVVQIDPATVPESVEPVACDGRAARSRTFDLRQGGLWRADFRFRPTPPPSGTLRVRGAVAGAELTYRVSVEGLAAKRVRLMASLPAGVLVRPGDVRVDGAPAAVTFADTIAIVTLGDLAPGDTRAVVLAPAAGAGTVRTAALFDAPLRANERVAPVELELGATAAAEASASYTGLRAPLTNAAAADDAQRAPVDLSLLEHLPRIDSLLPGRGWVLPSEGFAPAIPSLHVAVQHGPDENVALTVNGRPASELARDPPLYDSRRTLAVTKWRGIPLQEGANRLVVTYTDAAGAATAKLERVVHYGGSAVRAEVDAARSVLVADGRARPVIVARLYDRFGQPARPGTQGAFRVEPPYRAWWEVESVRRNPLVAVAPREPGYVVDENGYARIELEPTSRTGEAIVRVRLGEGREQELRAFLEPAVRDWVLVGVAEGTAAHRTLSSRAEALPDGAPADGYDGDGRVAFFAKGRVLGSWLLTLAYDSARERREAASRLQGVVDPHAYYTLYGDATEMRHDAPSQRKLYVKLERRQVAALFGDFDTGYTVNELTRYSRTLNGARVEGAFGAVRASAFAARTAQDSGRDFVPGDGTSGPYRLAARGILVGSERVRIETRDRFRSEVIVDTKTLQRWLDYDVDYLAGTLYFKRPVPTRDAALNPVYVVAEYETGGTGEQHVTAGGRATSTFLDGRVEAGATVVSEGGSTGERRLGGVDVRARLAPATELKLEAARTDSRDPLRPEDGAAYLARVAHVTERVDANVYVRQQDAGFGLGQQSVTEGGTRKYGGEGRWRVTEHVSVRSQAYRQESLERAAERVLGEAELRWDAGANSLGAGLRSARDRREGDAGARIREASNQAFASAARGFVGGRLVLRATAEAGLGGRGESLDFPDRARLGADWRLTPDALLFAEHERATGDTYAFDLTRVGVKSQPWAGGQLETAMNGAATENGTRLYSSVGLTQGWQASEAWSFDVGLERADTVRGTVGAPLTAPSAAPVPASDFTSAFVGALYRGTDWTLTSRLERRDALADERTLLSLGGYREVRAGQAFSAALRLVDANDALGGGTSADTRLSWAYRPAGSRWIVLDRLDLVYEDQPLAESARIVNNLHGSYALDARTQVGVQLGLRFARQTFGADTYDGWSGLYGVDARRDLDARWDVGFQATAFDVPDAGTREYSFGADLGRRFGGRLWVSLGYNFAGFSDRDFSRERYTARGPYLRFRLHVDQDALRELVQDWRPGTRP